MYIPEGDYHLKKSITHGKLCFDIVHPNLNFADAASHHGMQCNHVGGTTKYNAILELCKAANDIFKKIDEINNAVETEEFKGSELGLYDSDDPEKSSLYADKVIDVSGLCPKSSQCVVKYTSAKRGKIAQVNFLYEKGKDLGGQVHYFLDEMTPETLATDVVFERQAKFYGASPKQLAKVIFEHQ